MTQTIAPPSTLYERDLNLWLGDAISKLKAGDFQNLDIENLIEYAKINNVDGNANIDDSYFSVNFITTFQKKYSLLLGNSNKNSKRYLARSIHENTSEINIGYDFTANNFFDKLVLQVGYQHYINQTTSQAKQNFNSLGCLLRYYKNF